jgi:hypothetical protein
MSVNDYEVLRRIDEWVDKGNEEQDPFNKFISYWVAFNALYCLRAKKENPTIDETRGDRKKAIQIKVLISNRLDYIELYDEIITLLNKLNNFIPEKWSDGDKKYIKDELRDALNKPNNEKILEYLLKMTYKTRCNLMHGKKDYYNSNQRALLETYNPILLKLIIAGIAGYKEKYDII